MLLELRAAERAEAFARANLVAGEAAEREISDRLAVVTEQFRRHEAALKILQARDAALQGDYANLPFVDDSRDTSRDLSMGDQLPPDELKAAVALAALRPDQLGSTSSILQISLDPTYGFIVSSPQAGWQAAFGFYQADPLDLDSTVEARILAQAAGMRTLFAEQPEAGVAWIDARNPGRVYFRARG